MLGAPIDESPELWWNKAKEDLYISGDEKMGLELSSFKLRQTVGLIGEITEGINLLKTKEAGWELATPHIKKLNGYRDILLKILNDEKFGDLKSSPLWTEQPAHWRIDDANVLIQACSEPNRPSEFGESLLPLWKKVLAIARTASTKASEVPPPPRLPARAQAGGYRSKKRQSKKSRKYKKSRKPKQSRKTKRTKRVNTKRMKSKRTKIANTKRMKSKRTKIANTKRMKSKKKKNKTKSKKRKTKNNHGRIKAGYNPYPNP